MRRSLFPRFALALALGLLLLPASLMAQDKPEEGGKPAQENLDDEKPKSKQDARKENAESEKTVVAVPAARDSLPTWFNSYADGANAAREVKRQLLLVIQTEWDPWSQAMNESTWTDPRVLAYANRMVFTRVDADIDSLAISQYHVQRIPTTILTSDQGVEVERFVGYFGPEELATEILRAFEGEGTLWELERVQGESRSDPKPMMAVARKYLQRGEAQRAREWFERARLADPEGSAGIVDDAMFAEAQLNRDEGNWYKAIEGFKQLIKKYPASEWREDAELYIPWLYAQAGDKKEALKRYNEFLDDYKSSSETHWVKRQVERLSSAGESSPSPAPQPQPAPPTQPEGQ